MPKRFDCDKCPFVQDGARRVYMVGSKAFCSPECITFKKKHQEVRTYEQAKRERALARANGISYGQLHFEFGDGQ